MGGNNKMNYYDPESGGADCLYNHPMGRFLFTSTLKDFCEDEKAYWMLDVIASYRNVINKYDFLILTFDVKNEQCTFTAREDSDRDEIIYQFIEYTDLPFSIKLYWENQCVMFPGDR